MLPTPGLRVLWRAARTWNDDAVPLEAHVTSRSTISGETNAWVIVVARLPLIEVINGVLLRAIQLEVPVGHDVVITKPVTSHVQVWFEAARILEPPVVDGLVPVAATWASAFDNVNTTLLESAIELRRSHADGFSRNVRNSSCPRQLSWWR